MSLKSSIDTLVSDAALVHTFVHGTASQTVATENGAIKTLAKLVADAQAAVSQALTGTYTGNRVIVSTAGGAATTDPGLTYNLSTAALTLAGLLTVSAGTITTGSATALSLATTSGTHLTLANSGAHTLDNTLLAGDAGAETNGSCILSGRQGYAIVGALRSSAAAMFGFGAKPDGASGSGYVSSVNDTLGRTAIQMGVVQGAIGFMTSATSLAAVGSAISMYEQVRIIHTASADRYMTLTGGVAASGANATLGVSGGSLGISATVKATAAIWTTASFSLSNSLGNSKPALNSDASGNVYLYIIETAKAMFWRNGADTTTLMTLGDGGGLQLGAATGGDKGLGSINVAGDIYKNSAAYTNPDYVFEHWATGKIKKYAERVGAAEYRGLTPLDDLESFTRKHWHLPGFGQDAGHGMFSGSDRLLAAVEESYLHLFDHEHQIQDLLAWKAKAQTALEDHGITIN